MEGFESDTDEKWASLLMKLVLPYSRKFRIVQMFAFFEGRRQSSQQTGPAHTPVFHMQNLWWCGFLALNNRKYYNRKILLRALVPFRKNLHP